MRNKVLFMAVAVLGLASNILADNGLGNRSNGLGNLLESLLDAVVTTFNGLGN